MKSKKLLFGWWVVDKFYNNHKHRGPYKYRETASAVRSEMERNAGEKENARWNLVVERIAPKGEKV